MSIDRIIRGELPAEVVNKRIAWLHEHEGWSWKEIGEEFGLAPQAARMRYVRTHG